MIFREIGYRFIVLYEDYKGGFYDVGMCIGSGLFCRDIILYILFVCRFGMVWFFERVFVSKY